jgi:hypothetical protein
LDNSPEIKRAAVALPAIRDALARAMGNRLSIPEIAEALGRSERWAYMIVKDKNVPFIKVNGVRYLEPQDSALALVKQRNT